MTTTTGEWTPDSAPASNDTFGSLISFLIRAGFQKVQDLNPERLHRYYLVCKLCGGTDGLRPVGAKSSLDLVKHGGACTMAQHLPRLRELATTREPCPECGATDPHHDRTHPELP